MGKLAGGYIDVYLLEKSRVTYQQPNERCYHIFFQLIEEGVVEGLQDLVLMSTDPYDYFFVSRTRCIVYLKTCFSVLSRESEGGLD